MRIDPTLCVKCKGTRALCRRPVCPILERFKFSKLASLKVFGTKLWGATPPEILVGSKTWPVIRLGPLIPPVIGDEAEAYGNPALLYGKSIEEVIRIRSQLVRSVFALGVREARRPHRLLDLTRELAISSRPVDTEVKLKKPLKPRLKFDGILAPAGPSGSVEDMKIVGNVTVPGKVENLSMDYGVRATVAMRELYDYGIPTHYISRLLSVGVLGVPKDRLLVPSRWSITATDASISEHLRRKIVDYDELGEIRLFSQYYAGNRYEILLLPDALSYEMIEVWLPGSLYAPGATEAIVEVDGETWRGKARFSRTGGGYYAIKLPIYEYLHRIRRQAFAFAVREVTREYWAPLGSWKIREALRDAFRKPPKMFVTVEEALRDISSRVETPMEKWLRQARILSAYLTKVKIKEFLERK